jgi:SET domain
MRGRLLGNPLLPFPPGRRTRPEEKGNLIGRIFEEGTLTDMWTKGHELLLNALKIHPSYEKLAKFLTLDQFLLHLGSKAAGTKLTTGMFSANNLNGALYPLHSHINHSCQPNAKTVDENGRMAELTGNSPQRKELGLIEVVVRDNVIPTGAEITISYVDPEWRGSLRRDTLKRDYGFECRCERCMADLNDATVTDGKVE